MRKKNRKKIAIVAVISVVILAYFMYSIIKLVKQPTDTFLIEEGKLYNQENAIGYVIRQETVVQGNNYKNGMSQIKSEGERVSKGDSIFRYYSNNEQNLEKKIEELDIQIQQAMESQTDLLTASDMKLLENQIEEKLNEVVKVNEVKRIAEYKKDMNTQITKKAKIAGDLSPSGSHIRKLIEERSSYENTLNSGAEYITAPESGVVSYRVDGLENVLTVESFNTLNTKFLEDLKLRTGEIVASSSETGKVINNFECYIAITLDSEQAMSKKIGDNVVLRLSNGKEIDAQIEYIVEEEEQRLIIFKIKDEVEELSNYRKISVEVVWWSYSGLKVPNSAIIHENDLDYIVRTRAGYTDKILVKILKQNDTYAIISRYDNEELKGLGFDTTQIRQLKTISLYDEIILKP